MWRLGDTGKLPHVTSMGYMDMQHACTWHRLLVRSENSAASAYDYRLTIQTTSIIAECDRVVMGT